MINPALTGNVVRPITPTLAGPVASYAYPQTAYNPALIQGAIAPQNSFIMPGASAVVPNVSVMGYPNVYQGVANVGMPGQAYQVPPPGAIRSGQPVVREERMPTPNGIGRRIIIDEPFVVPQPPQRQIVNNVIQEHISIPQAPEARIIEQVVPRQVTIPQPPQRQIVREQFQRPILIPQTGKQIVQEVYRKPVIVQPPPQIQTVEDIIQKSILVEPPPRVVTYRQEYMEQPHIVGQQALMPRAIKLDNELQTMQSLQTKSMLQTQVINQGQLMGQPQVVGQSQAFVGTQVVGLPQMAPYQPQVMQGPTQFVGSQILPVVMPNQTVVGNTVVGGPIPAGIAQPYPGVSMAIPGQPADRVVQRL